MSTFILFTGIILLVLVLIWRYVDNSHGHVIQKITSTLSVQSNSAEECRRMAKKALRNSQFLKAEQLYERAKMLDGKQKTKK